MGSEAATVTDVVLLVAEPVNLWMATVTRAVVWLGLPEPVVTVTTVLGGVLIGLGVIPGDGGVVVGIETWRVRGCCCGG